MITPLIDLIGAALKNLSAANVARVSCPTDGDKLRGRIMSQKQLAMKSKIEKKINSRCVAVPADPTATSIYSHPHQKQYQRPADQTQREKHEDELL